MTRCPQCESLYCGPYACRFSGIPNNQINGNAHRTANLRLASLDRLGEMAATGSDERTHQQKEAA